MILYQLENRIILFRLFQRSLRAIFLLLLFSRLVNVVLFANEPRSDMIQDFRERHILWIDAKRWIKATFFIENWIESRMYANLNVWMTCFRERESEPGGNWECRNWLYQDRLRATIREWYMRMPYNLQAITRQEARFPGFWPQIPGNVMLCRTTVNEDKARCCPDSQSGEGEKHGEGGGGELRIEMSSALT